jgi:hypothetical protein
VTTSTEQTQRDWARRFAPFLVLGYV